MRLFAHFVKRAGILLSDSASCAVRCFARQLFNPSSTETDRLKGATFARCQKSFKRHLEMICVALSPKCVDYVRFRKLRWKLNNILRRKLF